MPIQVNNQWCFGVWLPWARKSYANLSRDLGVFGCFAVLAAQNSCKSKPKFSDIWVLGLDFKGNRLGPDLLFKIGVGGVGG